MVKFSSTHLQYGEVLEHAVHHVLLWQLLELVDEVDHVLAHWRALDAVDVAIVLHPRVLRLQTTRARYHIAQLYFVKSVQSD